MKVLQKDFVHWFGFKVTFMTLKGQILEFCCMSSLLLKLQLWNVLRGYRKP